MSDLGRRAYIHYWSTSLARTILVAPSKKALTVLDLRNETYIVPEDIIATLQAMDVLENRKKGGADAVRAIREGTIHPYVNTIAYDIGLFWVGDWEMEMGKEGNSGIPQ